MEEQTLFDVAPPRYGPATGVVVPHRSREFQRAHAALLPLRAAAEGPRKGDRHHRHTVISCTNRAPRWSQSSFRYCQLGAVSLTRDFQIGIVFPQERDSFGGHFGTPEIQLLEIRKGRQRGHTGVGDQRRGKIQFTKIGETR